MPGWEAGTTLSSAVRNRAQEVAEEMVVGEGRIASQLSTKIWTFIPSPPTLQSPLSVREGTTELQKAEVVSPLPPPCIAYSWGCGSCWVHQIKSNSSSSPSVFPFLTFLHHFFQNVHVVFLGNATQWRQLRLCYQLQQLWIKIEVASLREQRYLSNLNSWSHDTAKQSRHLFAAWK